MTSLAAYYVFVASSAAQKAAAEANRRDPRPSLAGRLRALAGALSARTQAPRPA